MLLPTTKDWTNEASCELDNLEPAKDTAPESTGLEQRDKLKITFNKNTVPARICKPNLLQSLFGDDDDEYYDKRSKATKNRKAEESKKNNFNYFLI